MPPGGRRSWPGQSRSLPENLRHLTRLSASVLLARPDGLERLCEVPVVAFEVVGLVAPETVEGVLDRHRDRGALGEGVLVVRVDVVDRDVDHHRRVADIAGTLEVMDVSRRWG